jgi:hypothetical protein
MDQNKNLASNGEAKNQGRFTHRVPNHYSPINLANNSIYNQLGLEAGLNINLGASMCFYVNKLDINQLNKLFASFPNNAAKTDRKQDKFKTLNWLSTTSYAPLGKNPSDVFKDSMELYNSFDIEREGKRITSYGLASVSMDFSKLPLVKSEDGFAAYPFGILFFSDLNNGFDSFNAAISTIPERRKDAQKCPYIAPINYDYRGQASCVGKYRLRGNFVIFYVSKEIEKQAGKFCPDINIINIPVGVVRDQKDWHIIKSTYACNIKRTSNCVMTSFIEYIVRDIFGFYGFTDAQPIAEIINAFGYDPIEYNYPPSISDEKSKYYGGNHVHISLSRNNFSRSEKPFDRNANLFSYLNAISKDSEIDIAVSAPKKEKDTSAKGKEKKKPTKKEKDISQEEIVTEIEPIEPSTSYSAEEIDAAFVSAVAEPEPNTDLPENSEECYEDYVPPSSDEEMDPEASKTPNNEESPQGENIVIQEEVANDGND